MRVSEKRARYEVAIRREGAGFLEQEEEEERKRRKQRFDRSLGSWRRLIGISAVRRMGIIYPFNNIELFIIKFLV